MSPERRRRSRIREKRERITPFEKEVENFLIDRGVEVVRCSYNSTQGALTVILDDSVDKYWATTLLRGSRKLFNTPPGPIKVSIGSRYSTEV